ncbi:hypothetical protein [Methylobacter sp.]|uniref:hypothetical protein n=1 Tax=Methylobacter sp. TaxID=2051955 RepID=UPI0011FC553E|nr:hypothetical protein [Methylobacter sp.]TAK59544.1 MAG: hypothetical protein EPO18_20495 [Methylobacter sp.]
MPKMKEKTPKVKIDYSREQLIDICERAIVPHGRWSNRDTPHSQRDVGQAWAYLKAGCVYKVKTKENNTVAGSACNTDEHTIWIEIIHKSFASMEDDEVQLERTTFYLPTLKRLESYDGRDWY